MIHARQHPVRTAGLTLLSVLVAGSKWSKTYPCTVAASAFRGLPPLFLVSSMRRSIRDAKRCEKGLALLLFL